MSDDAVPGSVLWARACRDALDAVEAGNVNRARVILREALGLKPVEAEAVRGCGGCGDLACDGCF